jgi:hypothetical protein
MGDGLPKSTAAHSSAHASALPAARGEGAAKQGKARKSEQLERDRTATEATTPDKPRSNERRAAKKKRKWETGVPAEHIADYWVARNKRNLKTYRNRYSACGQAARPCTSVKQALRPRTPSSACRHAH